MVGMTQYLPSLLKDFSDNHDRRVESSFIVAGASQFRALSAFSKAYYEL